MQDWRERLRLAVEQDGRKQAAIAWEAGIAPETLSRILSGSQPHLETVARVAHACGTTLRDPLKQLLSPRPDLHPRDCQRANAGRRSVG